MTPPDPRHIYAERLALARRLKWWRAVTGLKIEAAARQLGVAAATWGHWETGARFPSGEMLIALGGVTGMPLRVLFCGSLDRCPFVRDGVAPGPGALCCECAGTGMPAAAA